MNGYTIELDPEAPEKWKFLGAGRDANNVWYGVIAYQVRKIKDPNIYAKDVTVCAFNRDDLDHLLTTGRCSFVAIGDWDLNVGAVIEAQAQLSNPANAEFYVHTNQDVYHFLERISFCPPSWKGEGIALCKVTGASSEYQVPWVVPVPVRENNSDTPAFSHLFYRTLPQARPC